MQVSRRCACCGHAFIAIKQKQFYCCRRCFKKAYREAEKQKNLPHWKCPNCGRLTKLSFDPRKTTNLEKWINVVCSECGCKNQE